MLNSCCFLNQLEVRKNMTLQSNSSRSLTNWGYYSACFTSSAICASGSFLPDNTSAIGSDSGSSASGYACIAGSSVFTSSTVHPSSSSSESSSKSSSFLDSPEHSWINKSDILQVLILIFLFNSF